MKDLSNLGNIITQEHEKKWVAISMDYEEIVDFSEDLIELSKRIGNKEVIYHKVPPSDVYLTFTF